MNNYLASSKKRFSKVVLNKDQSEFERLLFELFEILNQLRYPWRRNEKMIRESYTF